MPSALNSLRDTNRQTFKDYFLIFLMSEEVQVTPRRIGDFIVTGYDLGGGASYHKVGEPLTKKERTQLLAKIYDSLQKSGYNASLGESFAKDPTITVDIQGINSRSVEAFIQEGYIELQPAFISAEGKVVGSEVGEKEMKYMSDEKERVLFKQFLKNFEKALT